MKRDWKTYAIAVLTAAMIWNCSYLFVLRQATKENRQADDKLAEIISEGFDVQTELTKKLVTLTTENSSLPSTEGLLDSMTGLTAMEYEARL